MTSRFDAVCDVFHILDYLGGVFNRKNNRPQPEGAGYGPGSHLDLPNKCLSVIANLVPYQGTVNCMNVSGSIAVGTPYSRVDDGLEPHFMIAYIEEFNRPIKNARPTTRLSLPSKNFD
jgi:hypothetical protein